MKKIVGVVVLSLVVLASDRFESEYLPSGSEKGMGYSSQKYGDLITNNRASDTDNRNAISDSYTPTQQLPRTPPSSKPSYTQQSDEGSSHRSVDIWPFPQLTQLPNDVDLSSLDSVTGDNAQFQPSVPKLEYAQVSVASSASSSTVPLPGIIYNIPPITTTPTQNTNIRPGVIGPTVTLITSVPTPTTIGLLFVGIITMLVVRRFRTNSQ